ncbi:MAG: winged helix-turn-helix domain-containing protein [Nanoarchaeota archaeon]|nr:winged helix-turn-helix domain-containing protein [Nanoarchaeota archaeon]
MSDKYINIDLDDERIGKIADAISNKTCKKILEILADGEMSGSEVSERLSIPLNTATYNLDILLEAGLIEKSSGFLWSEKGKRIVKYKVANKKIVISPKSSFKGILPSVLISGLIAGGIKIWYDNSVNTVNYAGDFAQESATAMLASDQVITKCVGGSGLAKCAGNLGDATSSISAISFADPALWFFFGALVALIILLLFNWRKVW